MDKSNFATFQDINRNIPAEHFTKVEIIKLNKTHIIFPMKEKESLLCIKCQCLAQQPSRCYNCKALYCNICREAMGSLASCANQRCAVDHFGMIFQDDTYNKQINNAFVRCPNLGCPKECGAPQMMNHLSKDCKFSQFQCNHCLKWASSDQMRKHINQECNKVPKLCLKCDSFWYKHKQVQHSCLRSMAARYKQMEEIYKKNKEEIVKIKKDIVKEQSRIQRFRENHGLLDDEYYNESARTREDFQEQSRQPERPTQPPPTNFSRAMHPNKHNPQRKDIFNPQIPHTLKDTHKPPQPIQHKPQPSKPKIQARQQQSFVEELKSPLIPAPQDAFDPAGLFPRLTKGNSHSKNEDSDKQITNPFGGNQGYWGNSNTQLPILPPGYFQLNSSLEYQHPGITMEEYRTINSIQQQCLQQQQEYLSKKRSHAQKEESKSYHQDKPPQSYPPEGNDEDDDYEDDGIGVSLSFVEQVLNEGASPEQPSILKQTMKELSSSSQTAPFSASDYSNAALKALSQKMALNINADSFKPAKDKCSKCKNKLDKVQPGVIRQKRQCRCCNELKKKAQGAFECVSCNDYVCEDCAETEMPREKHAAAILKAVGDAVVRDLV